jgi:tetratricopeptide (TPR) repeat protein/transglutaminase-like putative cysteine protease
MFLRMWRPLLLLLLLFSVVASGVAQTVAKPAAANRDNSKEAFVIEQYTQNERYEHDGTSYEEDSGRVRIQSEAGVQQYGVLTFSYASGTGTFEIAYVRVHKPDGSVIETPPEAAQDMAAQITRQAPFYSDLHEKHVTVKGLSVGDVLEYRTENHTTKPLASGQFWTSYRFTREPIVLDEQLEISVPRDRAVKIKSATVQPQISEKDGYRIYTWQTQNLQHKDETNQKREATEQVWQQARGRLPGPDVLLSSFASWSEMGRWYADLQAEKVKPTPEVAAKAAELTKDAPNTDAKLRALYNYVSTQFHYIGVAFGIGRYQPHGAGTVLENQYGDCKDKHTLLAAMLSAVGIPAYPAIISTTQEVDGDVPSPGQFDHVITVVPRGGALVWLDTTAEVGPYQYLLPPLRDKRALAIWKDKAELVMTPAHPPFDSTEKWNMNAKLNDSGAFEGHAEVTARGDVEYVLRAAFRMVAVQQWKELGQRISNNLGFGGDVSEVTASSSEKTDEPFHFAYKYARKDYGDWANHRTFAPEPIITLPAPGDEDLLPLGPVFLGEPSDIEFDSTMELPDGYRPEIPATVHWKRDFAQYDATYEFKDHKLIAHRHLKTVMPEIPAKERDDYKEFVKTVQDDYGQFIPFAGTPGTSSASSETNSAVSSMSSLRNLPDSSNEEATHLESEARDALAKQDLQGAVSSLYRAVTTDPKFARAWVMLGGALLAQKQYDAATDAFRKAIAAAPEEAAIPKALGLSLMALNQYDNALPVWKDFVKAHPSDVDGAMNLGRCLWQVKKYSEAAETFETGAKLGEDGATVQTLLGLAYLKAGDREKAASAFTKLGELDPKGINFNNVAYEMANADLKLPLALHYSKKAVRTVEEDSQKLTLSGLKVDDLRAIFTLAADWDTLGWVQERMSDMASAEQYLRASWDLTQDGVVAGHLCHLYRRTRQTANAIEMCRLAIYRIPLSEQLGLDEYKTELDAAQENLDFLTGKDSKSNAVDAADIVVRERIFKLPHFLTGTETAEFFVLLASDGRSKSFKVEDVKFISGSDKMKLEGKQLKGIDFKVPAPDNVPSRFVRRGVLGCYPASGCSFVLLDPATLRTLN